MTEKISGANLGFEKEIFIKNIMFCGLKWLEMKKNLLLKH